MSEEKSQKEPVEVELHVKASETLQKSAAEDVEVEDPEDSKAVLEQLTKDVEWT